MEDKIRRLCSQLLAKRRDEEFGPLIVELRVALHQHIERLRERFGAYPYFVERRIRSDISPPDKRNQDGAAKDTSPADANTETTGQLNLEVGH
ncbi:MAG: hypothetical protein WB660_26285 [Candidatus Sulfotelmatobacter sp.]